MNHRDKFQIERTFLRAICYDALQTDGKTMTMEKLPSFQKKIIY